MVKAYTGPTTRPMYCTLGPLLTDNAGTLYAVISGHAKWAMVRKCPIEICTRSGTKLPARLYCIRDADDTYDISLVIFKDNFKKVIKPIYMNMSKRINSCTLYTGSGKELEGQTVFLAPVLFDSKPIPTGTVVSPPCKTNPGYFFAKISLAKPGDSGRTIAMEVADGHILLLGILCAKDERNGSFLCLLLHKGIEVLNDRFHLGLTLLQPEEDNHPETQIIPGAKCIFQTYTDADRTLLKEKQKRIKPIGLRFGFHISVIIASFLLTTCAYFPLECEIT